MKRPGTNTVRDAFSDAQIGDVAIRPARKRKAPAPFSIRFTEEERATLKKSAGSLSEAAYIRSRLFASEDGIKQRATRKRRTPTINQSLLARLLGELGQSRLSSNLNQIAKAANMGALPMTTELERELWEACEAVKGMRIALTDALGLRAK